MTLDDLLQMRTDLDCNHDWQPFLIADEPYPKLEACWQCRGLRISDKFAKEFYDRAYNDYVPDKAAG